MLGLLFKALTLRWASRFASDIEDRMELSRQALHRTGVGALFLQVAGPFLVFGFGFWLTAVFLTLSDLPRFVWPSIWTGGVSVLWALLLAWRAFAIMKNPRA